ncbi:hypothetical protein FRC01_014014 [Tulasnella sp. 417]|nr:hypothetical protein FRC01_014014 [Tulasnella sp. 417]
MNKSSSVATQKPSSSSSAWAKGPPSVQQSASPSRSPSSTTPATPTHSRKSSILSSAVSVKDGVSVPMGIAATSSHRNSGFNFGTIDANGSSGPSAAASAAVPPVVNGSAGTPPPTKDAPAAPKAFGTLPAQSNASSTAASSTAAPSPTPSNASTAATSSAAPPKRKLDANKFFQTSSAPAAQPTASAAPPPTTAPPPSSAVPPFHPNAPNSSLMAANVAVNSPGQRFQSLPPPANHVAAPYYHSPQMANQQPVGVGVPPQSHLRPVQPSTGGPRSPSFSSRLPINGAGVPPPPAVTVNGASQGRGPQPAAGQPTVPPTGTVPQVNSPRLGHQPPVMQHQQQQPPGGPVPAPGQMPGQPPYPGQPMQMGWQQPPYGGWQPQYPQYPYMNPDWYPHMQQPNMHQHPYQTPYMQPPGTPHQPYAPSLPPTQQPPTPANTMSPRTGPMSTLPPQAPGATGPPQINTNLPPSVPSTPGPGRPTSLTPSAREFVPSSSPMIPSPGFPLPKKSTAIKISNPNTGEAVVFRPPDGGHGRNLSVSGTSAVHESSPLRKTPIKMETQEEKKAREEKERKDKEEADAKKKKEAEAKLKKEEEEREAKRKAEEAERLKKEEEERLKKEAEEKAKRDAEEKKRQEEEAARRKKEEEERLQREAEERALKEKEEQERKEREERERVERELKEREEAEAKAKAEEEERLRKEAEEAAAAKLAAETKAKEEAEAKEREEREKLQAPALSRTASASSVATPLTASPKPGSASLPAKPHLPPISTNTDRPKPQRPVPGPLDLSHTQRPPLTPGLPSALASARKIDDLDSVTYPEGIKTPVEMNQGQTKGGKYKYDRDFLLQFMQVCKDKPDNLSSLDALGIERGAGDESGPPYSSSLGRSRGGRVNSIGQPQTGRSSSVNLGLGLSGFGGGKGPTSFAMGNFSSTPSRMTSEERFAMSNRERTVSVGGVGRGVPMSRSSSHGGVGGIGGPNAVPQSPREQQNRVRSQRGRTRNDSLKPNAPQSSQQQQQQQALIGLEPVAQLQQSENRWTPATRSKLAVDENSPEFVERKVKALLNKLTLENFDSVSNQIIAWANKSENEKNGATLISVIKLVFEKATDEAHWSEMYARLCRKMMEQISPNVQDDNIRNNSGEPIVGGHLFRKYLLNRCQEDFERGWSQKESAQAAAALKAASDKAAEDASKANGEDGEPVLYSEEYYALLKAKRQGLGLVRFIGELFKLQMLTERIMHECIKKLLSKIDNPEEEEIESLCKLLTTVGQALDTPKAKGHMDIYFGRMQMLADNPNVASRIRYMLLDVIELRQRSWRPRNATAGPSTIAQVREQDAKEKAAAAQQASKMVPMARGGSQRGGRGAPEQGPDGWNVAGPTPVRAPAKAGDLSNFGKFTANSGPLKTMGPSSVFKKGDRGRDTPPPSNNTPISRASSGANMFSLLGAGGADADTMPKRTPSGRGTTRKQSVDQAPQPPVETPSTPARRKLNLLPRTVSSANTNEDSAGDEDKPESDEEQAAPTKSYTEQEAKAKAEEDVKEFFNIRDVSEGEKSFAEMPDEHKSKLVDKLASKALDSKESDVKLVADLFERVASKGCPASAFEDGLAGIIEFLDDTATDVPQAYTFMARMLRGAKLSQEAVESLADKIYVDGDPVVSPKEKLLKAYAALA